VQKKTDTLEIGSKAPEFTLAAANPQGNFSLRGLIGRGPLVIEFLRGTW
jgi:peroxiredoxin